MVKMYYDQDVDYSSVQGKTIAIIGYGSQGRAQANNMRDSGLHVVLGLRPHGQSWQLAKKEGFTPLPIAEAAQQGDILHILIPDTVQPLVYEKYLAPHLSEGKTISFAHGFNIHFQTITPPPNVDIVMVAPKAPGLSLREMYVKQFGVPALIAVQQDFSGHAKQTVLAMAKALGCTKAGVIETTFRDETESDLIGEQVVLVGGIMELIRHGYEILVELGYPPELAYFEACNESKLIIDQIYRSGVLGMLKAVSDTAKYGGLSVGPKIIDSHVRANMIAAAKRVRDGSFATEWLDEDAQGRPNMTREIEAWANHPLEVIGNEIRKMSGLKE